MTKLIALLRRTGYKTVLIFMMSKLININSLFYEIHFPCSIGVLVF